MLAISRWLFGCRSPRPASAGVSAAPCEAIRGFGLAFVDFHCLAPGVLGLLDLSELRVEVAEPMPALAVIRVVIRELPQVLQPLGGRRSGVPSHNARTATVTRLMSDGSCWSCSCGSEPVQSEAGLKAHVCLPGARLTSGERGTANGERGAGSGHTSACRGPASPPACRGPASPPACRGLPHLQPAGVVPPTATTASVSRSARQTGRYAQPSPPDVRTPAKWHLL